VWGNNSRVNEGAGARLSDKYIGQSKTVTMGLILKDCPTKNTIQVCLGLGVVDKAEVRGGPSAATSDQHRHFKGKGKYKEVPRHNVPLPRVSGVTA
jgi:hypothetical protein